MKAWFRRYWPWLVAFAWLIAYELYAVGCQVWAGVPTECPATLSRQVWRAQAEWSGLVWVATGIIVVLWIHFWWRRK